jgi:uncharacterized protein YeaO (DUF488 family)
MILLKRSYETPSKADGRRFLVDRLWPRGLKKEDLKLEAWLKEVSPSTELCRWFSHDPGRWVEFRRRYFAELDSRGAVWQPLRDAARQGKVTLVYSARDTEHNNAVVLKDYLERKI